MKYLILLFVLISPMASATVFEELHGNCVEYTNNQLADLGSSDLIDWALSMQDEYGIRAAVEMSRLMFTIQCKNTQQQELIRIIEGSSSVSFYGNSMSLPSEIARRFTINGKNERFKDRDVKDEITPDDKRKAAVRRHIEDLKEDIRLKNADLI